ncbi:MAG: ABC transporter permease [Gordonia sp. (in: high G+C Gram-positive bacteria)]
MNAQLVRKTAGLIVGLSIAIPLILLMFIGPSSRGTPHDLPIGVVGPQAAVTQMSAALEQKQPGAFEVHAYASAEDLQRATRDRDVYGGLVLGPQPQTIIATGASPVVAGTLTQIGQQAAQRTGATPELVDVAPAAQDDPRGAGFGSVVMPVFIAGAALGIALTQVVRRGTLIALLLPVAAALIGAAVVGAAMLVGVLPGGFWAQWLAMSGGILAIGSAVAGLVSLIGMAGVGIAAMFFMIVGMPLSGIASPPEFLPGIWGTVGQWLPLGATGTALRDAAFFADGSLIGPGAGAAFGVIVLWIAIGYALLGASMLKRRMLQNELLGDGVVVEPDGEERELVPAAG